jgi:ribosomal protein S18 acetylase RimI-like enzyme
MQFFAEPATRELCAAIADLAPANPMCTWAYAEAIRKLGSQPVIAGLRTESTIICGSIAILRAGRLNQELELSSTPAIPEPAASIFWSGLVAYCRDRHISSLAAYTFGSSGVTISRLEGETKRASRAEFVLDLPGADLLMALDTTHRRWVRKAEKAGVTIERTREVSACEDLVHLSRASMQRRSGRGEDVPAHVDTSITKAMLETGGAEAFRAILEGQCVSIVIVMRAAQGGYLHASGTHPDGMKTGASHFLNYQIAKTLQEEGCELYNLSGASEEDSGLARYKAGFGARVVPLETAEAYLGSALKRKLTTAAHLIRSNPGAFVRTVVGHLDRWVVYRASTTELAPPEFPEGACFRKLSDEDLQSLPMPNELREEQRDRTKRLGRNAAYGLFCDRKLAHISWLIVPECESPKQLNLKPGEAEITACVTLPEFRGRGLYAAAIRALVQTAREAGIQTVLMKTTPSNTASQRGIEKAGLTRCGELIQYVNPYIRLHPAAVTRSYRR